MLENVLTGQRVIDITDDKGAFCIGLLADMGAEITRLDPYTATAACLESAKETDILVESLAPGHLPSLGLGYSALKEINPRLIMASITPFGQSGPYRDFRSSELVSAALGGQVYVCGEPGKPPLEPFGPTAYGTAALFAANGILLALWQRHATGRGQYIDISIHECVAATLDHVLVRYFSEGVVAERSGSLYWNQAFRIFPCRDGYVLLSLHHQWQTLVEWLDAEGMAQDLTDMRWVDENERRTHIDHIIDVLGKWALTHTAAELVEQGQLMRFPWAQVAAPTDVLNSPQMKARGFFERGGGLAAL